MLHGVDYIMMPEHTLNSRASTILKIGVFFYYNGCCVAMVFVG
jgi:hypothetical protein